MPLFKKPACDWMLVGLGNPGAQYARTRHNMGFLALDLLEKQLGADKEKQRHQALCASAVWHGQKLLLVRPQTFMNASGLAVQQAANYYKLPPERIVVLFDDISLPVGKIRVRPSGSAGGHNGIKNIIAHLRAGDRPVPAREDRRRRQAQSGLRSGGLGARNRPEGRSARAANCAGACGGRGAVPY